MDRYYKIILIYVILINIITLILYAADKAKAKKRKWRIPEATLLIFTFLGGSIGALIGMLGLRHKTQHTKFKVLVPRIRNIGSGWGQRYRW